MLKTDDLIGWRLLLSLCLIGGVVRPGLALVPAADNSPAPDNRGLCQLNNLAGRSIIDPQGQLINLLDFCEQQQTLQLTEPQLIPDSDHSQANPEENQEEFQQEAFWRSFTEVASSDAVQFSNTLDRQQIIAYGATICPYLNNGGTLQQVRQIQAQGKRPTSFDVAVTIAAIHTDCPEYTGQIGR